MPSAQAQINQAMREMQAKINSPEAGRHVFQQSMGWKLEVDRRARFPVKYYHHVSHYLQVLHYVSAWREAHPELRRLVDEQLYFGLTNNLISTNGDNGMLMLLEDGRLHPSNDVVISAQFPDYKAYITQETLGSLRGKRYLDGKAAKQGLVGKIFKPEAAPGTAIVPDEIEQARQQLIQKLFVDVPLVVGDKLNVKRYLEQLKIYHQYYPQETTEPSKP